MTAAYAALFAALVVGGVVMLVSISAAFARLQAQSDAASEPPASEGGDQR